MKRSDMKRELSAELDACGFQWPRHLPRTWALDRLLDAISDDGVRGHRQAVYEVFKDARDSHGAA